VSDGGPDPRHKPLGCGVTVTDWRLYAADPAAGTRPRKNCAISAALVEFAMLVRSAKFKCSSSK
jgi:hypothetical protein